MNVTEMHRSIEWNLSVASLSSLLSGKKPFWKQGMIIIKLLSFLYLNWPHSADMAESDMSSMLVQKVPNKVPTHRNAALLKTNIFPIHPLKKPHHDYAEDCWSC